jgi:hypothetical protein
VAATFAWVVATVRAALGFAAGAGFAAATFVVCFTVLAVVIVRLDSDAVGAVALVSVAGAGSSTAGAGGVVVMGAGSVVTGCVCCGASCAITWVEESARAAAIAGKALVRA